MTAARTSPQSSAIALSALSAARTPAAPDVKDQKSTVNQDGQAAAAPVVDVGARAAIPRLKPPAQDESAFPFIDGSAQAPAPLVYQACNKEELDGEMLIGCTLRYDAKFTCITSADQHPMLVPVRIINTNNLLEEHWVYDAFTLLDQLLFDKDTSPITRVRIKTLVVDEKLELDRREHFKERFGLLLSMIDERGGIKLGDTAQLRELIEGISSEKKKNLSDQLKEYGINIRGDGYPYYENPVAVHNPIAGQSLLLFGKPIRNGTTITLDYKEVCDSVSNVGRLMVREWQIGIRDGRAEVAADAIALNQAREDGFNEGRRVAYISQEIEREAEDEREAGLCFQNCLQWVALGPKVAAYVFVGGTSSLLLVDSFSPFDDSLSVNSKYFMGFVPFFSSCFAETAFGITEMFKLFQNRFARCFSSIAQVTFALRIPLEAGALFAIEAAIENSFRIQQIQQQHPQPNANQNLGYHYQATFDEHRWKSLAIVGGLSALRMGLFYYWKNRDRNRNYDPNDAFLPGPRGNRNS